MVKMKVVYFKCGVFLKLVCFWILSLVLIIIVFTYLRLPHHHQEIIKPKTTGSKPTTSRLPDIMYEANKMVKANLNEEQRKLLQKTNEQKLEKLQFFPKIDQVNLLNAALVNRPELKNFLKERFNITEKGKNIGPQKPIPVGKLFKVSDIDSGILSRRRVDYVINVRDKCLVQTPFILIVVHSKWSHKEQRDLIRQTWAGITSYRGHVIRTVFLLARPGDQSEIIKRTITQNDILLERQKFDDIIQGDFIDDYRNLTRKHLMGYHWILSHCNRANFIVKVDDDTLVNTFRLVNYLTSTDNTLLRKKDHIYCSAFVNQGPRRDKTDRWYVDKVEYPHDKYPTYCEGFAYITTTQTVFRIYNASLYTPFYWIDDVFVTGILAKIADIGHKQFREPNSYTVIGHSWTKKDDHNAQNVLFFLEKYVKDEGIWMRLWKLIFRSYKDGVYTTNSRYKNIKLALPNNVL
jgi:beta-1,3-galactosyltransferase 1